MAEATIDTKGVLSPSPLSPGSDTKNKFQTLIIFFHVSLSTLSSDAKFDLQLY